MSRSGNKVIYVVTSLPNETKDIESHLRNEGIAARARSVADADALLHEMGVLPPDLVVHSESGGARFEDTTAICREREPKVPVVVLAGSLALDRTLSAMDGGARDLVCLSEPHHMALILYREIEAYVSDVSRANLARRLKELESQHSHLLKETGAARATVQEGIMIACNPSWARLHGYDSEDEIAGLPLMDTIAEPDRDRVKKSLGEWDSLGDDTTFVELSGLKQDGSTIALAIEVSASVHDDDPCIELSARPSQAPPDSKNNSSGAKGGGESDRLALSDALNDLISDGVDEPRAAAFFIRVDNYENTEDRIGFLDAELIMQQLKKLIGEHFLKDADLFRYSLSELTVIAHSAEATVFRDIGDALVKRVAEHQFRTDNHELNMTVSVITYPLTGTEQPQKLLRELNAAARDLSSTSGNKAEFSGPAAESAETREQEKALLDDIRAALKENRLQLAYQTIASLEGNRPPIFDTWLRMIDTAGNELMARDFLPIAERHELMPLIDHWVVQRAVHMIREKTTASPPEQITLFARLSETTVRNNEAFLTWLNKHLTANPIPEQSLVFEVEERSVLEFSVQGKALASTLKQLNAGLAIVHFGNSPDSISLLESLRPDFVKLDPSYTGSLTGPDSKADDIAQLMDATRQHDVLTVAERIDDANAMARLWQLGINYLQGNHVQEAEVVLSAADVHIS